MHKISIIIPANNEAALIDACLSAVLASDDPSCAVEVLVMANGCTDGTVPLARAHTRAFQGRGWTLHVRDLGPVGKLGALNAGDDAAFGDMRVYLDADVTVSPPLLAQLRVALDRPDPAYASGQVRITAQGAFSRAYARFWARVPFMARGVPGCGLFAVNAAGRSLWHRFPAIISDDTYVRLQFPPGQRMSVDATYDWPIAEGFARLVRVRRRQDHGVREIARRYPSLMAHDDTLPLGPRGVLHLALADPVGFVAYVGVALAVRIWPASSGWSRGR